MSIKWLQTILLTSALLVSAAPALAEDGAKQPAKTGTVKEQAEAKPQDEAKELSGISIVGNKEAPKSLFIVPWKSSELGVETGLASSLLNEDLKPVDKEVFERELDFYSITAVE